MPHIRKTRRLGTSVRFPHDELRDYEELADGLGRVAVSRLLVNLAMEVVRPLHQMVERERGHREKNQDLSAPHLGAGGLIADIQKKPSCHDVCHLIAARRFESLPNDKTESIWLGFSPADRLLLQDVSQSILWAEGKVILQAIRDAVALAALTGRPKHAPILATLYLGVARFKQEEPSFLEKIEETVAMNRRPPLEPEKPLEPVTIEGIFEDIVGRTPPDSENRPS